MQRSRSAVIERQVAETGTRAAEKAADTVTELAERAVWWPVKPSAWPVRHCAAPPTAQRRP